eukprot:8704437-Karenia_brevis.AAC.1
MLERAVGKNLVLILHNFSLSSEDETRDIRDYNVVETGGGTSGRDPASLWGHLRPTTSDKGGS